MPRRVVITAVSLALGLAAQPRKGDKVCVDRPVTFTAISGSLLDIGARKTGGDLLLSLVDPGGKVVITADTPGDPGGRATLAWILDQAGNYTIRVAKPDRVQHASVCYEIESVESRAVSDNDRNRIRAEARLFAAAAAERQANRAVAIQLYQEAAQLWKQVAAGAAEESYSLHRTGLLYSESGDQAKAVEVLQKALAMRREAGDRLGQSRTLNALGTASLRLGDQRKSLDLYAEKLEIERVLDDRAAQATTLNQMAYGYSALGEQQKMLDAFTQVHGLRRALGDKAAEATALNNVALAHYSTGDQQKALDAYQQVLAMRRAIGDRVGEARSLTILGNVYRDLGAEQTALEYYQQSIATGRAAGDRSVEGDTETGIGDVYFFLGEKQKSIDAYNRAAALKRAAADRTGEALALIGIANVYADLASRQKPADSMGLAGKRKALEFYEQSLAIGRVANDYPVQVFALMGAGVAYSATGDKKKATDYLNQALFFFGLVRMKPGEGWAKYELARVERDRGNLDKALLLAGSARDIIESLRSKVISQDLRASFFAAVHDCFGLEVDVLMSMHAADPTKNFQAEALTASERARARVLLETLGESHADIRQGVDAQLLEQERVLQAQLNAKELARMQMMGTKQTPESVNQMQKEVRDLAARYEDVNTKIRASSPHYAALKFPQPLNLKEIQSQVLDADTLLLEYALGEQRSFLWVVSVDGIKSVILPKRSDIEEAARRFHDALIEPGSSAAEHGKVLSRMLLGEAALGSKRLLIVADGALQYLPFAALPDPDGYQQPLMVNHEIVNVASASTLAVLRRENSTRKPAPKMLAVMADPVFSADDARVGRAKAAAEAERGRALDRSLNDLGLTGVRLTRLPGTRREAAGIAALVPASERKQSLDFEANRATITSPEIGQYRILHLATHGLLNTIHPELSGIVLSLVDARGQPQDGFLRLHEIYNLKLAADLVVLSACQTGLGKEIRGEGLVGLTRGFMYAGAPRVLASLWKVDDRATAELMKRLYGAMLGREALRPAAALRAAQIEMWKTKGWENPYYWAAFTLQGEWR